MWWWNEEVKNTIVRKKVAFIHLYRLKVKSAVYRFPSEKNKTHHNLLRNQTTKIVARAMRMEANQELNNLYQNSNSFLFP